MNQSAQQPNSRRKANRAISAHWRILFFILTALGILSAATPVIASHAPDEKAKRLELQHHLDYDAPLGAATFFGTHNSFNSKGYKGGLGIRLYPVPNHQETMTTQLDKGARVLSLDIHPLNGDVLLCHFAADGETGCTSTDLDFGTGLGEIYDWLVLHPREVVMILIEDRLTSSSDYETADEDVRTALGALVFKPSDYTGSSMDCNDIPLRTLTKRDILNAGRQVLVATDGGCDQDGSIWRDWVWNMPFRAIPASSTTSAPFFVYGPLRYPHAWSVLYEDRAIGTAKNLTLPNLHDGIRRGAGVIGLDFLVSDDRRAAVIWSWAENEPNDAGGAEDCAESTETGWNDRSCAAARVYACQSTLDGSWTVTATNTAGAWSGGDDACQLLGEEFVFSVPINATLNASLRAAAGTQSVWINYTDSDSFGASEGLWIARDFVPAQAAPFVLDGSTPVAVSSFDANKIFHLWKIPEDTVRDTLLLRVFGGVGGNATHQCDDIVCTGADSIATGGRLGLVVEFAIGDAPGEIAPGAELGFIPGENGESDQKSGFDTATGGGGGASAVILFPPGTDEWRLLAVAGGGGGATSHFHYVWPASGSEHRRSNGSNDNSFPEDTSGGSKNAGSGGGGAGSDGAGFFPCLLSELGGGKAGGYGTGDRGGASGTILCPPRQHGGFGYGGGGTSGENAFTGFGGGGGGGYKGGNGGGDRAAGEAGGSFVDQAGLLIVAGAGQGFGRVEAYLVTRKPVATADTYDTAEDATLSVGAPGVLGNDTAADIAADTLTAVLDSSTSSGSLTLNSDGSFGYLPNANFCGDDSFTYHANDGRADSTVVRTTIRVSCVDDAPMAAAEIYFMAEGATLSVSAPGVLGNDTDADTDDTLTAVLDSSTSNGSLTLNSNGSFGYVPNANFCGFSNSAGFDYFTYHANDGRADSTVVTTTIRVFCINEAPTFTIPEATVVVANDSGAQTMTGFATDFIPGPADESSQTLDSYISRNCSGCALLTAGPSVDTSGTLRFTPASNASGTVTFELQVKDSGGTANGGADTSLPQTVTIYINSSALLISADSTAVTVDEGQNASNIGSFVSTQDSPVAVKLAASVGSVTQESKRWSWSFDAKDGPDESQTVVITATDANNAVSVLLFSLTVNNLAPTVSADSSAVSVQQGGTAENTGTFADPGTDVVAISASAGTVKQDGTQSGTWYWTYEADVGNPPTQVTITATDVGGSTATSDTATATVTFALTVPNVAPLALGETFGAQEDTTLNAATPGVLANDVDPGGDMLSAVLDSGPDNGTLTLNGNGSFTYVPNADFCGTDTFNYHANDGTSSSNVVTATVNVACVNDAPVADDEAYDATEDTELLVAAAGVLEGDTDIDGNAMEAVRDTTTSHGALSLNADGSFTYAPNLNYCGPDSFTYHASDGSADSDVATVSITVACVNDAPVVTLAGPAEANEGDAKPYAFTVADADSGETFTVTSQNCGANGSLSNSIFDSTTGSGSFDCTFPDGPDSSTVSVQVADSDGANSNVGSIAVTISNVAPAVTVDNATSPVQYSDPITVTKFTATDVASDPLTMELSWSGDGLPFAPGLPDLLDASTVSCTAKTGANTNTCERTVSGIAGIEPGTYTLRMTTTDEDGAVTSADTVFTVKSEDAHATYTGPLFSSSDGDGFFEITLMATIQDITAATTDPATDPDAGDIRNATVTFKDGDKVLCTDTSVTLIIAGDQTVGSASCVYSDTLGGTEEERDLNVTTVVDNFYTAGTSDNEVVVLVAKPGDGKITGGGQLELTDSAGTYAGGVGLRTNYGFNAFNVQKKKIQLKGRATIIVRGADGRKYKIKSNTLLSLGVDLDPDGDGNAEVEPHYAEFEAKANLEDVTDPLNPVSLGGNLLLQLRMVDNGEPGENDTISFTLWDGGTLLFSSNWDGVQSVEQLVGRGNLQVH